MGYCVDDCFVRVDFFKTSGKWYQTEAIEWTGSYSGVESIHEAFAKSLRDHLGNRLKDAGVDAICLEPYHESSHPICIKNGGWNLFSE